MHIFQKKAKLYNRVDYNKFLEKIKILEELLIQNNTSCLNLFGIDLKQLEEELKTNGVISIKNDLERIVSVFNINLSTLIRSDIDLDNTKIIYKPTLYKLQYLSNFLRDEKQITLARAISVRENKMNDILKGKRKASNRILKKVSEYFMMKDNRLVNNEPLPDYKSIKIDEELLKVQRNDDNEFTFFKNRHFIRKNFGLLGYGKRVKLILSMLVIIIPLGFYTGYCATLVTNERIETIDKYKQGSDESVIYDKYNKKQVEYHEKLMKTDKSNDPNAYYCDIKVGSKLYRISEISASSNSYVTRMELYFKFDKAEFHTMFKHYAINALSNLIINDYNKENPDNIKPNDQSVTNWLETHEDYINKWVIVNGKNYYPGETPSNVLVEKQTMFDIGNGGFVADSYGTVKELEEIEYFDNNGNSHILCYQKVKFEAKFEKAFDSYRYPLDSIQLKMYIQPTMDATYLRYYPDRDKTSNGENISGFSSYFAITNGYRLIKEKDGISNFNQKINYYQDVNNDPAVGEYEHTYKTQLEIIVRANRQGISLFLQAFVNLFSVIIWIGIAFYNQSYNGEDSIGMLGTGLFGAISSVLVGISMVSDAGLFSLITMLNIFTLAVIMIMAYHSISARRAIVKQDKIAIAYNGVKLRITFFILMLCTIVMFIGLPFISYLFTL